MLLKELRLYDYCQYESKVVQFSPGLNGIFGANGVGKSNLAGAIKFSLTGILPNQATKAEHIRQGSNPKSRARVELDFEHEGVDYTVVRNLRSAASTLQWNDQKISGERAVTEEIMRMLAVSEERLTRAVFGSQTSLTHILDATNAMRQVIFSELFDLFAAEEIREAALKELTEAAKSMPSQLSYLDIPATRLDVETREKRIQEILLAMTFLGTEAVRDARRKELERRIYETDASASRQQEIQTQWVAIRSLQVAVEQSGKQHQEAVDAMPGLQELLASSGDDASKARAAMENANRYVMVHQRIKALEVDEAAFVQRLGTLVPPQPSEGWEESWAVGCPQQLLFERQSLKQFLDSVQALQACPTCQRPFEHKVDTAGKRERLAVLEAEIGVLTHRKKQHDGYAHLLQHHNVMARDLEARLAACRQQLQQLKETTPPVVPSVDVERGLVAQHEHVRQMAKDLQDAINRLFQQWKSNEAALQSRQQMVEQLERQQSLTVLLTEEQLAAAKLELGELHNKSQRARELQIECETHRAVLPNLKLQLQAAVDADVLRSATIGWTEFVEQLRNVFAKDQAPRLVSVSNMQALQADVNAGVQLFDANFRLEVQDDMAMVAVFPDGKRVSVNLLSRGQKTVLGVCLWLSIHFMLAGNVGMQILDEPTESLDSHNVQSFIPVLSKLRMLGSSGHLQFIIVTHHTELKPHFDNVIELFGSA